jgi:hypothetical protein
LGKRGQVVEEGVGEEFTVPNRPVVDLELGVVLLQEQVGVEIILQLVQSALDIEVSPDVLREFEEMELSNSPVLRLGNAIGVQEALDIGPGALAYELEDGKVHF